MKSRILLASVLLASVSTAQAQTTTAPAAITSGVKAIDTICAKSFKALAAGTIEEIQALQLTSTSNATCQKLLISSTGNLLTELSTLGFQMQLTATTYLDAGSYANYMAQAPDYGDVFAGIFEQYRAEYETSAVSEANEKLEYIQTSIDELNASGGSPQALAMLNLSLGAQQEVLATLTKRVQKLAQASNLSSLAGGVGYIGQILAQPLAPRVDAPAATPAQPATPGNTGTTGTTSPEIPANTPAVTPENPSPEPEPQPAPEPGPNPAPAPDPVPVP